MKLGRFILCVAVWGACGDDPVTAGMGDDTGAAGNASDGGDVVSDSEGGDEDATDDATGDAIDGATGQGDAGDGDAQVDGEEPDEVAPDADGADPGAEDPGPPADEGPGPSKECPPGCDDGRPCTTNTCDDNGECLFPIVDEACLIGNVCYEVAWAHGDNPCVVCDPGQSITEWSLADAGTPCGDDDKCLQNGECAEGQCIAEIVSCDDGNDCTDDSCHPEFGCLTAENFDPCEDGDPCTLQDFCADGECVTSLLPLVCEDDESCTNDACGPDGCVFIPKAGACSDGTECTVDDFCQKSECLSGPPLNCDDGNVCTVDKCDPFLGCNYSLVDSVCCITGVSLCDDQNPCTNDVCDEDQATCEYSSNTAGCDDNQPCTGPDKCKDQVCSGPQKTCDDNNACTADTCSDELGGCQHASADADCDDGNACTQNDGCLGGTCTGSPMNCNDSEACTQDSCDPLVGCVYAQLSGACNDANACTENDACTSQGCKGAVKNCGDGNPCTNDSCHPITGCHHQPVGGPCSDGLDCSLNDSCQAGQCVADVSDCGCLPDFSDVVTKLTQLIIGTDGQPGNGLDVDSDPTTCAPPGKCSGGIDNSLAGFSALANKSLLDGVNEGKIVLLMEHENFKSTGQLYTLNVMPAKKTKGSNCNVQTQVCDYEVEGSALDEDTCLPLISFDNAKIKNGNKLTAGGVGYSFPLDLPANGADIPIVLSNARVVADVVIQDGVIVSLDGVLAGAVPKQTFLDGIDQLEDKDLESIGLDKATLKLLIGAIVQNDVDLDNDGNPDAASLGLVIKGIQGHIVGIK